MNMNEEKMRKKMMRKTKGELLDKVSDAFGLMDWDSTFDNAGFLTELPARPKKELVEVIVTLIEMCEE
jgi:hypothetical protein